MTHIIYWTSKIFFYLCALLLVFITIFSILGIAKFYWQWEIPFVQIINQERSYVFVNLPFLETGLRFPPGWLIILPLLTFSFYTYYFDKLQAFFGVFIEQHLFTKNNLKKMKIFLWLNMLLAIGGLLMIFISWIGAKSFIIDETIIVVVLHLFIALLIFLYYDVARKGLRIQEENDLTI